MLKYSSHNNSFGNDCPLLRSRQESYGQLFRMKADGQWKQDSQEKISKLNNRKKKKKRIDDYEHYVLPNSSSMKRGQKMKNNKSMPDNTLFDRL